MPEGCNQNAKRNPYIAYEAKEEAGLRRVIELI
jgi:hypothetical protein